MVDIQGQTPLHKAAQHRHLQSCRLLVHAGSDPHITSLWDLQHFNCLTKTSRTYCAVVLVRELTYRNIQSHDTH
ncbi:MAG: hypothetical protein ACRC0X_00750 [Brevinema sp.]